ILDPGPEFVESGLSSPHEGRAVHRQLDATRRAVEQGSFDCVLKGGDRLRNGGLGHAKMKARLTHASMLRNGKQNMQIAQPDAFADPAIPFERLGHQCELMPSSENWRFPF